MKITAIRRAFAHVPECKTEINAPAYEYTDVRTNLVPCRGHGYVFTDTDPEKTFTSYFFYRCNDGEYYTNLKEYTFKKIGEHIYMKNENGQFQRGEIVRVESELEKKMIIA